MDARCQVRRGHEEGGQHTTGASNRGTESVRRIGGGSWYRRSPRTFSEEDRSGPSGRPGLRRRGGLSHVPGREGSPGMLGVSQREPRRGGLHGAPPEGRPAAWLPGPASRAGRGLQSGLLTVSVTLAMSLNLSEPRLLNATGRMLTGNAEPLNGVSSSGELWDFCEFQLVGASCQQARDPGSQAGWRQDC